MEFFSLSKTYNYTGARMSFLVGNREIIAGFKKLRSQIDYGTFLPVQYGAIAALNGPEEPSSDSVRNTREEGDALCGGLRAARLECAGQRGEPCSPGARIPEGFTDDVDFVMKLMEGHRRSLHAGSSFGTLGKGPCPFRPHPSGAGDRGGCGGRKEKRHPFLNSFRKGIDRRLFSGVY